MYLFLSSAAGTDAAAGGGSMIIMMVVLIAVFYFLMIRPENKRKKEAEAMRNALKVGDNITTIGGIIGDIVSVKDDSIVLETSSDRVRVEFAKFAVSTNNTAEKEAVEPYMPADRPRYLMGVGTPSNIIESVARGVDFFDCVMPARNARHGRLFTWSGAVNMKNAKYERDERPIDPECDCPVCRRFSRSYIHHLFKAEEMLAMRLSVMHNLYFYNKLTERIRAALDDGCFADFRAEYSEKLSQKI